MTMESPDNCSLLALEVTDGIAGASDLFRSQPPAEYNAAEQRLSVLVQRALDRLIVGRCDQMVLLKLYPQRADLSVATPDGTQTRRATGGEPADRVGSETARWALRTMWPSIDAEAVRRESLERLAADAIGFFGPLYGGVVTQTAYSDVIVQGRRFTTAYPHINLERFDAYDATTHLPALGAWRARRLQNQRRETRLNRTIDTALLVLEISQALFPRLLG